MVKLTSLTAILCQKSAFLTRSSITLLRFNVKTSLFVLYNLSQFHHP